jgi:V/A-type H+-transporting ATPase subunit D
MWLTRRLAVATRGGDLLENKLRILLAEQQNFALMAERTGAQWEATVVELEDWMMRSALLSGERGVRLASDGADAHVDIAWRLTMGVRYPAEAVTEIPLRQAPAFAPDNTALRHASAAAERAVTAGVDHAIATTALAAVGAEISSTRRQMRAIRERWIPRLQHELSALGRRLDDEEHDEHLRLRWAADPSLPGRARS